MRYALTRLSDSQQFQFDVDPSALDQWIADHPCYGRPVWTETIPAWTDASVDPPVEHAEQVIQHPAEFMVAEVAPDRDAIKAAVNVERERRLDALTVTVAGITYDADPVGKGSLEGVLTASASGVPVPWPLPWRGTDNVVRPLSQTDAVQLAGAMLLVVQSLMAASWLLKDAVIPNLTDEQAAAFNVADDVHWQQEP